MRPFRSLCPGRATHAYARTLSRTGRTLSRPGNIFQIYESVNVDWPFTALASQRWTQVPTRDALPYAKRVRDLGNRPYAARSAVNAEFKLLSLVSATKVDLIGRVAGALRSTRTATLLFTAGAEGNFPTPPMAPALPVARSPAARGQVARPSGPPLAGAPSRSRL